jgi:hypothetical protein
MISRKELIEEFNKINQKHRELSFALHQRYIIIVRKHKDNKAKLEHYLDECPDCSSKMMFYQVLLELREKEALKNIDNVQ